MVIRVKCERTRGESKLSMKAQCPSSQVVTIIGSFLQGQTLLLLSTDMTSFWLAQEGTADEQENIFNFNP